jgi:hypothetical protein
MFTHFRRTQILGNAEVYKLNYFGHIGVNYVCVNVCRICILLLLKQQVSYPINDWQAKQGEQSRKESIWDVAPVYLPSRQSQSIIRGIEKYLLLFSECNTRLASTFLWRSERQEGVTVGGWAVGTVDAAAAAPSAVVLCRNPLSSTF